MAAASLIPELEEVVRHGSAKRRAEMLRRITALFVAGASRFNSDHIQLFGDVLTQLSGDVDANSRVELAHLLAPVPNAPPALLRRLAEDENIAVAQPILKQSPQLGEPDLIDIAQSKGQAHLLALSKRKAIGAPLTDILVGRGERDVLHSLAENLDAQLSQEAYAALIERAVQDDVLAEKIGSRRDIAPRLFCNLLLKSKQTVRDRLTASARPEVQSEMRQVLGEAAHSAAEPRDYSVAERAIRDLHQHGRTRRGTHPRVCKSEAIRGAGRGACRALRGAAHRGRSADGKRSIGPHPDSLQGSGLGLADGSRDHGRDSGGQREIKCGA